MTSEDEITFRDDGDGHLRMFTAAHPERVYVYTPCGTEASQACGWSNTGEPIAEPTRAPLSKWDLQHLQLLEVDAEGKIVFPATNQCSRCRNVYHHAAKKAGRFFPTLPYQETRYTNTGPWVCKDCLKEGE